MAQIQEIWAKVSATERFIVYGAGAAAVGWILGLIFGNGQVCAGAFCVSTVNYFFSGLSALLALLLLVGVVAAVVAVYLRYAPNTNFKWPVPYAQALLGIGGACAAVAVLLLLIHVSDSAPLMLFVADLVMIAGGGVMAWFAYQYWLANKTAA